MIKYYTKAFINISSIFISIIIICILKIFSSIEIPTKQLKVSFFSQEANNIINNISDEKSQIKENIIQQNETKTENVVTNTKKDENWYIEIPSINLKAYIAEGTTKEIMDNFVGHFEETDKTEGVIGLASHNRGYKNNYFENLKKLKEGDEIIYKYENYQRTYIVEKHIIIEDTDWTNLEKSQEKNQITLITCVENEPNYRRCIVGIEK